MSEYVFFCSHKEGSFPQFSNWFPAEYTSNGVKYPCVEKEFMCGKALAFGDQETADKIMATEDAGEMKALGRGTKGYVDAEWMTKREDVMYNAVKAKFEQNVGLAAILILTENKVIVEAADYDKIWGIGYSDENAFANIDNWGENKLGKILMRVREELKTKVGGDSFLTAELKKMKISNDNIST